MVRIQVKYRSNSDSNNGSENEFVYECESSSRIEDMTKHMVEIANLQCQIQHIALQLLPCLSPLLHTHPKEIISLHRALSEAESYASKDQTVHNKLISSYVLRDHLRSIEKEFTGSYQAMGFSDSNFEQLLAGCPMVERYDLLNLMAGWKENFWTNTDPVGLLVERRLSWLSTLVT